MTSRQTPLTAEILRELVTYDPDTGNFTWRRRKLRHGLERIDRGWNTRLAGNPVAKRRHRHGHLQIGLAEYGSNFMAHRLAWLYVHGSWPSMDLDHINGKHDDNRIANLREVTKSQNLMNQKMRVNNTSGVTGVSWAAKSKKWSAQIQVRGKMISLGRFVDKDEAIRVRQEAEDRYFGEFMRGKFTSSQVGATPSAS